MKMAWTCEHISGYTFTRRIQDAILCTRTQHEDSQRIIRKLALDYVNFAKECWIHTAVRNF